ncbi:MAG: hypothetical protein AAFN74_26010, partial [Myxococcota bacterium]
VWVVDPRSEPEANESMGSHRARENRSRRRSSGVEYAVTGCAEFGCVGQADIIDVLIRLAGSY